jgi:hypothetical protein
MTDWNLIFSSVDERDVQRFVTGDLSGRALLNSFWNPEAKSHLNTQFRRRGTDGVREIARKALSRR